MKHTFSVLILLLFITSCSNTSTSEMRLTAEIKGLKKGTVLLQKLNDTAFMNVDSILVDGSSVFQFSEELESPEVFYLTIKFKDSVTAQKRLAFFGEPGDINVQTTLKKYETEAVIKGSTNQEKWEEHGNLLNRYTSKNLDLIEKKLNALRDGNDSIATAAQARQDKLLSSQYLATVNYALNNKDYEIAPYLMLTEVYDANIKYLDTIYSSLTPKIKDSKYGKALESYIQDRKK